MHLHRQVADGQSVQQELSIPESKLSFIVELAPWQGGAYERMVQFCKMLSSQTSKSLSTVCGYACNTLMEAEAVVNSHPFISVGDEFDLNRILSPAHFLSLNPKIGVPSLQQIEGIENLSTLIPAQSTLLIVYTTNSLHY